MLSTEAPPPDLPCPCVISQQKSCTSNIDERDSDNNNQKQLEVDLLKSDLDDANNNPLPKFSIRDYVSSARGKDIKTSWPFSQKNLQLCLKHGVTDVLPPFQSLNIVRDPSLMKCVDVKLPGVRDNILSRGFQEEKGFEHATTHSYSNINHIPPIKTPPCSEPEVANLPRSCRVEKSSQNPVKNCKLIVKLSKIGEVQSNEHSEMIASKVCPVCKTFSSSSNTTLNAHIDQCLSGVSTIDWTSSSKMNKHRIKPRKTRLMVDIYETALHGTLEDLDRRNGTNWASNMVLSSQDLEECAKEKKKKKMKKKKIDSFGDVYVDSSGTKFLSLSKCSDLPFNSHAKDDCGTRKLVISKQESKFPSRMKKKVLVKKQKPLHRSHYVQTSSSPGPSHCPEVNNAQQKKLCREEGYEEGYKVQTVKAQMKSGEMGMLKQSVGSKRTGFRKISHEHQKEFPDKTVKNLRIKECMKGTSGSYSPVFSDENPLLPSECHKRKENLRYISHNEPIKQPSPQKKAGLSMMSGVCHSKSNRQSRKDCPLVHKRHDPLKGTENLEFSRSSKRNECSFSNSRMSHQYAFSSGFKDLAYSRQPPLDHVVSPGYKKLSSLRKKLSVTHASVPKSKEDSRKRHLNFKKPRLYYTSESDDEAVVPRYAICGRDNQVEKLGVKAAQMEKTSVQSSMKQTTKVFKIIKKGVFLNSGKEVDMASMGSEISPESDSRGVRNIIDSFMGGGVPASTSNVLDAVKEAENQDEFVCELISEREDGEAFTAFRKSLDSPFYELAGPSDVECVTERYIEAYKQPSPDELLLGGEPEMFCADKVAKNMASSDTLMVAGMDANEGQGNYFVDVDQIPIPGPPGSFLPSPGRMSSEELQGNSSLTTCRIQSSEDKHELMDMNSSDSPISYASLVSESTAGRLDSLSVKNLSELSDGNQHQSRCKISEDRAVESSNLSEMTSRVEGKLNLGGSRADLMLTATNPHIFKNIQPCSCPRNEGALLIDSFDCQESQLLQRRSIASVAQRPPGEVQTPEADKCVSNAQMGYAPMPVSWNSDSKFPPCNDCESPSLSTSNPVLRLMGKNLMVVNKGETSSPQTRPTHLSMAKDDHPSMLSNVDNGVSFPNEYYSVHQTLSRVPSMFDHMQQPSMLAQHLAASSPNCFRDTANIRMQLSSPHSPTFMLSSNSFGGSLASPSERHEYTVGYPLSIHVNPGFYNNQTLGYPLRNGSQAFYDHRVPTSKGINPVQWNCTREGSAILHPNSLTASSPATGHPRSSLYFSPGFS